MNTAQYDLVKIKIDKTKTWIEPRTKILYSREIKNKHYCTFAVRYAPKENRTNYFIIMSDEHIDKSAELNKEQDLYGRVRIKLNPVWNLLNIPINKKSFNVDISIYDKQSDGIVYYIDI